MQKEERDCVVWGVDSDKTGFSGMTDLKGILSFHGNSVSSVYEQLNFD